MSESIKWQDCDVRVEAWLVPDFLWTTATIEVLLDGRCILGTGGQLKFTGLRTAAFVHNGTTHKVELEWGASGLGFSVPYQLRIDGLGVARSRVFVQNWRMALIAVVLVILLGAAIFHLFHGRQLPLT